MNAAIAKPNKPVTETRYTGTWSNGIPTPTTNAYIDAGYTTAAGSFACRDLIITASAVLTVTANTHVKVLNNLQQSPASRIIVKAGGELMLLNKDADVTTAKITAEATYKNLQRLDYAFISSPISGIPLKSLSPGTSDDRFYRYTESTDQTDSLNPNTNFTVLGEGYQIRVSSNFPTAITDFNISINNITGGNINSGVIYFPVKRTNYGFNLIGNPYNAKLSFKKFYEANKHLIDGNFYIWENRTNASQGYRYTFYNFHTNNFNAKDTNIPAFQSFLIQVKEPGSVSNIIFSPDMIVKDIDFSIPDRFYINLFQTSINFPIGGTCYNVKKYISNFYNTPYQSAIISIIKNANYVIYQEEEFSKDIILILRLNVNATATYKLSLKDVSGLFDSMPSIFLTDTITGITHNLKAADYTFTSNAGVFTNRFSIKFQ